MMQSSCIMSDLVCCTCTLDIAIFIQEIRIFIANKAERQTKDIVIHRHGTASERFPRASNDSLSDPLHPPGGRNVGPSVTG